MAKRSRGRRGRAGNGNRHERALVDLFREWGLEARRVPVPGSTEAAAAGDEARIPDRSGAEADIYKVGRAPPMIGQCKTQPDGFKQLYAWLEGDGADYLALRAENAEWLFVLPERVMRELLTQ